MLSFLEILFGKFLFTQNKKLYMCCICLYKNISFGCSKSKIHLSNGENTENIMPSHNLIMVLIISVRFTC